MTLQTEYPDQTDLLDSYKDVFESLKLLEPEVNGMMIVLSMLTDGDLEGEPYRYVDVSGRKIISDKSVFSESCALEFTKWEKWLGMEFEPETIRDFNELEIISHCIFEMTFCAFEQDEIQNQFDQISKDIDELKNLSESERKKSTISLDDLLKSFRVQGGS